MNTETRIVEPGRMETPLAAIRFLLFPGRDLFTRRAERLRNLAAGHPLEEYLAFLALLAEAQQTALDRFPTVPLPGPEEQALCRSHGMPILAARSWRRDPAWQEGLAAILHRLQDTALPTAALDAVNGLLHAGKTMVEEVANRVLSGDLHDVPPRELPFVAAALQVYWVRMAALPGEQAFGRLEEVGVCPVCGSHPNVGIVHGKGAEQGLRYLSCSLCSSQWHMVRIKCSSCDSTRGINYFVPEGSNGAVKAECCADCGIYLKLLYLEKESGLEVMADDLATLGLDMLMAEKEKSRVGPNLFFHPGTI